MRGGSDGDVGKGADSRLATGVSGDRAARAVLCNQSANPFGKRDSQGQFV